MHQTHLPAPYQPQRPIPYAAYPPVPYRVSAKNPAVLALVSAFLMPGLGSILAGAAITGTVILVLFFGSVFVVTALGFVTFGVGWLLFFFLPLLLLPVWIWGIVDAYVQAKNWNARHGIVS